MNLLAEYLRANELRPAEFARLAGISQPMVSQMLHGKRKPGRRVSHLIEALTGGAVPARSWDEPEDNVAPAATTDPQDRRMSHVRQCAAACPERTAKSSPEVSRGS